eukprot:290510-Amphidinium_carterae.1
MMGNWCAISQPTGVSVQQPYAILEHVLRGAVAQVFNLIVLSVSTQALIGEAGTGFVQGIWFGNLLHQ